MRRPEEPSPAGWALLGLLSFGRELSGYDLKKWSDGSFRFFFWSPSISQIYAELKRLQSIGYVESDVVIQETVRSKRVYRITDDGRTALKEWIEDAPVELPVMKHQVMVRLWLGHLAEPDKLRALLDQHRRQTVELAELIRHYAAGASGHRMPMPEAVLHWAERSLDAEVESIDVMLEGIGAAAEPPGIPQGPWYPEDE